MPDEHLRKLTHELQVERDALLVRVKQLENPAAVLAMAADTEVGRTLIEKFGKFGDLERAVRQRSGIHHTRECPRSLLIEDKETCVCSLEDLTKGMLR